MCGTRCICRGSSPSRSERGFSRYGLLLVGPVHRVRVIEPLDLVELAHDDELVAVRTHRTVIVEAVGELRIAADHVRRLEQRAGDGIVNAAALPRNLRSRHIYDLLLC